MKFFLLSTLFASALLAKTLSLATPQETFSHYHQAKCSGDMITLAKVTTKQTFDTDVNYAAFSLSAINPKFKKVLNDYYKSDKARKLVIEVISDKFKKRKCNKVEVLSVTSLGKDRVMLRYLANKRKVQHYLSKHGKDWIMDYLAGRKLSTKTN